MSDNRYIYDIGDEPFARRHPEGLLCPFCGKAQTIISWDDINEDHGRIEFYCNNSDCEVRTFICIADKIGQRNDRSDVTALHEIDFGTEYERLPDILDVTSRLGITLIENNQREINNRRQRPAIIKIVPKD